MVWERAGGESGILRLWRRPGLLFLLVRSEGGLVYFVFDLERTKPIEGVAGDALDPVVKVVSMGWHSATGIAQHLHGNQARRGLERAPASVRRFLR